ncbi:MAG: hypothetical protein NTY53_24645, partial [Kiritimatiellaeota bacterium]|nr:hypothetical protein [Kiritimatiellota bacterium]
MKGICALLAVLAVRGVAAEWSPAPGVVSGEIKAQQKPDYSYVLYLPKAFNSQRAWPVMFVMSPGGGSKGTLSRYVAGAELNGWILACSVQSKNGNELSGEAVNAMVTDVCTRLPVDRARLYASGFSGGARMAFWFGSQKPARYPLAGVLACGAGAHPEII